MQSKVCTVYIYRGQVSLYICMQCSQFPRRHSIHTTSMAYQERKEQQWQIQRGFVHLHLNVPCKVLHKILMVLKTEKPPFLYSGSKAPFLLESAIAC